MPPGYPIFLPVKAAEYSRSHGGLPTNGKLISNTCNIRGWRGEVEKGGAGGEGLVMYKILKYTTTSMLRCVSGPCYGKAI